MIFFSLISLSHIVFLLPLDLLPFVPPILSARPFLHYLAVPSVERGSAGGARHASAAAAGSAATLTELATAAASAVTEPRLKESCTLTVIYTFCRYWYSYHQGFGSGSAQIRIFLPCPDPGKKVRK